MAEDTQEVKAEKKAKEPKEPKPMRLREGLTEEQVKERKAELTLEEAPEGWVKMSVLGEKCRELGIPVSKLVRATGGDRAMDPPVSPEFKVRYVGRTRYLPPEAETVGLEKLADPEFLKTRRTRKVKDASDSEDHEPGSGPVRSTRKKRVVKQ